ncbi:uncharacterized protein [Clytia hemisphaerica]|uniref:uncharacterized protein n=1 Tax=Clytia hemisphaerica TaxID=252671 RepID=UPI0034D58B89
MAAALARKKARREAFRTSLKEIIEEANKELVNEDLGQAKMVSLKQRMETSIEELSTLDGEIANSLDAEEVQRDVLDSIEAVKPTYEILANLQFRLEKLHLDTMKVSNSVPERANSSASSVTKSCRLPKLELPTFKGDVLKWRGFIEQFSKTVDDDESLSDINKFIYLKRRFDDEVWTLDKFIEYMNKEIRTSENCSSFLGGSSSSPSSKGKSTTWNLFGGMSEDVADKCVFCSKDHASHKCRKVTNVKSRTDMLRRDRRCFLCLKKGHQKRECRVKYICRNCNGKHNIAICFGNGDRNERNRERDRDRNRGERDQENRVRNGDRGGEDRERDQDDGESLEEIQQGLVMSARAERESILLQTATVYIQDKCKRQGSSSKILFDSGSQRSFVTQALRDKLQLKSERKEKVVIKTFGEGDNNKKVSKFLDVVTIKVKHKGRNSFTAVEALFVPRICGSISKVFDRSKYDHLRDSELADTFNAVSIDYPVGVLVGIDFYHDFFSGKTKTGKSGPVASETVVGWVLSRKVKAKVKSEEDSYCFLNFRCSVESDSDRQLKESLDRFWEVENIGRKDCVIHQFEQDIVNTGERGLRTEKPLSNRQCAQSELRYDNREIHSGTAYGI